MGSQEEVQGSGDLKDSKRPDVLPDVDIERVLDESLTGDESTSEAETFELAEESMENPVSSLPKPESSEDQEQVYEVTEEVQVDANAANIAKPTLSDPSSDSSEKSEKIKRIAVTYVQVEEGELEKKKDDKKKDSEKASPAVLPPFQDEPLNERGWLWIGVFVILSNLVMAIIELLAYIPEIKERTTRANQMEEGPLFRRVPYQCFEYFESQWGTVVRHQGHSEYRFIVGYFLVELGAIFVLMTNCYVWRRQRSSEKSKLPPKHATVFQNYSFQYQSCLLLILISYLLCPLNFSLIIRSSNFRSAVFGVSLVIRFATWVFVIKDCDTNKNYIWVLNKRNDKMTASETDVEKSDKASEALQADDGDSTNEGLEPCKKRRVFPTIKELLFDTVGDMHRWKLRPKPTKQDPAKKAE